MPEIADLRMTHSEGGRRVAADTTRGRRGGVAFGAALPATGRVQPVAGSQTIKVGGGGFGATSGRAAGAVRPPRGRI